MTEKAFDVKFVLLLMAVSRLSPLELRGGILRFAVLALGARLVIRATRCTTTASRLTSLLPAGLLFLRLLCTLPLLEFSGLLLFELDHTYLIQENDEVRPLVLEEFMVPKLVDLLFQPDTVRTIMLGVVIWSLPQHPDLLQECMELLEVGVWIIVFDQI